MTALANITVRLVSIALIALAGLLVVGAASQATAAASSPVLALAAGDFDGICDDWEDAEDPDCVDPGEEGEGGDDPVDTGEPTEPTDPEEEVCDWDLGCEDWWDEGEDEEEEIQWPAPPKGAYAKLRPGGRTATIPKGAPKPIRKMIRAANSLTKKPYKWGGGHARWKDRGYDCSGAVSYVLNAGGYLARPLTSGGLAKWGKSGAGKWVRVYAKKDHVFMVVAGLRFDTTPWGASGGKGPRWRATVRPTKGFKLRHPAGL